MKREYIATLGSNGGNSSFHNKHIYILYIYFFVYVYKMRIYICIYVHIIHIQILCKIFQYICGFYLPAIYIIYTQNILHYTLWCMLKYIIMLLNSYRVQSSSNWRFLNIFKICYQNIFTSIKKITYENLRLRKIRSLQILPFVFTCKCIFCLNSNFHFYTNSERWGEAV